MVARFSDLRATMCAATVEKAISMENLDAAEFTVVFSPRKTNRRSTLRRSTRTTPTFKDKFGRILTEPFEDEESWWLAAGAVFKGEEFAEKVARNSKEGVEESRKQAIVEVMVDLLLGMEGITEHKGLVYVLDEGLESYPMELMARELLKRGADPNNEKGYSGCTPLHLAITEEKTDLVKRLLEKGAFPETKDDYGSTPLLTAVRFNAPEVIIDLLLEGGANVHTLAEDRKTALHFIAQKRGEMKMLRAMIARGLSVDAEDNDGWTPLHEAAQHGNTDAAEVLIEKGASVNARDHRKRTPLHVAAEEGEEELIILLLENKADSNVADVEGNTPLDLAARKLNQSAVSILLELSQSSKKDEAVKKTLEKAMESDTVKDDFVGRKFGQLSPLSVVNMFKPEKSGGKYQFLQHFALNPKLKKTTKAIMDQFVLGKTRGCVHCEIIEADGKGNPPDEASFEESGQSLLDVIVAQNDKELAQHPSIQAILDYKWRTFGRWLFTISLMVYAVRMLFFGLALLIAARPDLDNPGCYRDGWDYFRGICEGIALILFLFKLADEIQEMFSFPKVYYKDYYNYMQLLAVILPLLIIPFRAATTWCASTGDGYCVDPTIVPNSTNITLDINDACITASQFQWIVASLAYMANAALVIEYLSLFRTTGVYVRIIIEIFVSDMLKFSVIFIVGLYIFVGSYYLALRAGLHSIDTETGAITTDLEVFTLQTIYPWNVLFTGLRILFEAGDVYDGLYFAVDESGQYTGYQWFPIVMYLVFLFAVIVVLLNLLIAQMSDTYTKVQEDVEGTFAIARARIIARLQKGKWLFCKESYRKRYFKKEVWTELSDEELKQQEEADNSEEKVVMMQQKIDRLEELAAELSRNLNKREDKALDYKSELEQKVDKMAADLTKRQLEREATALEYKSLIEQKVAKLEGEVSRKLEEREHTAREYKQLMEQKLDLLDARAADLTKRQLQREDTALEYKSLMEQKIDRLTEMTAELTRRLQRDGGDGTHRVNLHW